MPIKDPLFEHKEPYVGIAVVGWNNEKILPECLKSIKSQNYKKIKTIVLDNGSSDNTVELIEHQYPWVELIKSSTNLGFAKGNNIIIDKFMNDKNIKYVVLLNSDATINFDWVTKLVSFSQSREKVAFLQGLTLDFFDHEIIDSTHIYINRHGQAIQSGYRQAVTSLKLVDKKVFGVNAAACMITREFLEKQPFNYLFDEDFFMYLEDVDVAARSVALGWNNYFVPEALAYHMGSASSGRNPGFSVYLVNRNLLPTLVKNLPSGIIIKIIPRLIIADTRELYRITKGKNYKVLRKFIAGRIKGVLIIPIYLKKAAKISKLRKTSKRTLWQLMADGTECDQISES